MRFCLAPRCPNQIEGRRVAYCPEHTRVESHWDRRKQDRPSSGWEWGSIRKKVLRRDANLCQVPGCSAHATEVDHIIPRHQGGTDELTNLRAMCSDHHRTKSEQERLAALRNRGA
jgi:5-methylcytosine-specific restriction protein A